MFLLTGDTFLPEMLLRQPGFIFSACGPFTKNKERIQKSKETGDSGYVYQNEVDKFSFKMTWLMEVFKAYPGRAASDKVLRDKAFNH